MKASAQPLLQSVGVIAPSTHPPSEQQARFTLFTELPTVQSYAGGAGVGVPVDGDGSGAGLGSGICAGSGTGSGVPPLPSAVHEHWHASVADRPSSDRS